jgi:hypothetical protein
VVATSRTILKKDAGRDKSRRLYKLAPNVRECIYKGLGLVTDRMDGKKLRAFVTKMK